MRFITVFIFAFIFMMILLNLTSECPLYRVTHSYLCFIITLNIVLVRSFVNSELCTLSATCILVDVLADLWLSFDLACILSAEERWSSIFHANLGEVRRVLRCRLQGGRKEAMGIGISILVNIAWNCLIEVFYSISRQFIRGCLVLFHTR